MTLPTRRVLIGTPAYDGKVEVRHSHALAQTVRMGMQRGIDVRELYFPGDAIIQNARNNIVKDALKFGFDDLIMIDADQDWEPEWVFKLLSYPVDCVGGTARRKEETESYQLHVNGGVKSITHAAVPGLLTAPDLALGTGFLRLSKNAMQALWNSSEEYRYKLDAEPTRWMFDIRPMNGLLIGEDIMLGNKLRSLGFKTYLDPTMTCGHTGSKHYKGDFGKWLAGKLPVPRTKIAVAMLSRNRTHKMIATMMAFKALSSGEHDVVFGLRSDPSDPATARLAASLPFPVQILDAPRHFSIGQSLNEIIGQMDADIYVPMADDIFPMLKGWDDVLVRNIAVGTPDFLAWTDEGTPNQATYLAATREWLSLGPLFDNHFPFWFADSWAVEVYLLAKGHYPRIVPELRLSGDRGKTSGMNDLSFWWTLFAQTRNERIALAQRYCDALGTKIDVLKDRAGIINALCQADTAAIARAPHIETVYRDPNAGDLTAEYLTAKREAEAYLQQNAQMANIASKHASA